MTKAIARRRFIQTQALDVRLAAKAKSLREHADLLPHGAVRDSVLRKIREVETAGRITGWLRRPQETLPLGGR